jgi:hypothetical protein
MSALARSLARFALPALLLLPPTASPAAGDDALPIWLRGRTRLSTSGLRMLRDAYRRGAPFPAAAVRRLGLDAEECGSEADATPAESRGVAPAGTRRAQTLALSPDHPVNDKSADATCANCGGRPLGQAETTIASSGYDVLASWNDALGFCPPFPAVQGYGYSTDGGDTWVDAGEVPSPIAGARWRGDPLTAVNRKTGDFYIGGLFENPTNSSFDPGSGLAFLRGHFGGSPFTIDFNAQIAVAGSGVNGPNFDDKPWLAADSLSGNLYMTVSYYVDVLNADQAQIELLRSTTNGSTWDPPLVLSPLGGAQGSRVLVGPAGEVYVVWYEFGFPQSHLWVRKSTDFGASFAPAVKITDFYENDLSGAPGFRRGGGVNLPGAALDLSTGPHRGRLYVTWSESVDFFDAPPPSGTAVGEAENNAFFSRATPFSIGDVIVGSLGTSADVDLYRFSGTRGQTVFLRTNTADAQAIMNMRLICAADTSTLNNYRFLAFDQAYYPALGFTLPATGTYYLRLDRASGATPNAYTVQTSFDTPTPGERARDHRDSFASVSDGGAVWSTPVRLNDDDPWYDAVFPEITVDGTGTAHCFWHDFRDDGACGATSYEYMTSSANGGASWGPNRRVSDEASFWSVNTCGSANQGDYQGVTSEGATFRPCWSDSRLGDPDVFTQASTFQIGGGCTAPTSYNGGSTAILNATFANAGDVPGSFGWTISDDNGWMTGALPSPSGTVALAASGQQDLQGYFQLPYGCTPAAVDTVRFVFSDLNIPGSALSCKTTITCTSVLAAGDALPTTLAFAAPRPNPSSGVVAFDFDLPRPAAVRLSIFGARGEVVRALASGDRPAGRHHATWDGRDARGRRAPPGLYFARFEAEGRSFRRTVALVK